MADGEEEYVPTESVSDVENLERWEAPEETSGVVQHYTNEALGLCPFYDGVRDHYDMYVRYKPDEYCIELKSLKFYLQQFEDMRISHERLCGTVYEDLKTVLDPEWIEVHTSVGRRGGIDTGVIHSNRPEDENNNEVDMLTEISSRE